MKERIHLGRDVNPRILIINSQSIELAPMIYEHRGIGGNKKVNGRERQLLVDVLGRIWKARVHAAHKHAELEIRSFWKILRRKCLA